jgi:hypothetical protein
MNARVKKALLLLLATALLVGSSRLQVLLNRDREALDLTRVQPLENAPPVLAFTTVALGGFRGLISNMLWMRASALQDEDKFFEMAQLSDWITKLEPHFVQVWIFQAWNMAYNISVKFKDNSPGEYPDRWRWVKRGIELLRDEGLRYNPNEVLLYRELAGLFQHKIGANMDDAHMYYKQQWANEMATNVFGKLRDPNVEELVSPQTDDARARARALREKYKMDAAFMREVDRRYGPLEWRLPEAHAIYWAALGLSEAAKNPTKVKKDDLMTLRRMIYQSLLLSFMRGRLEVNRVEKVFDFGPNLEVVNALNDAYLQAMADEPENREHIAKAHRNFLRQAVYFLYVNNRIPDAAKWFKELGDKYPDKPILDDDPNSLPGRVTLDQYAVANVQIDINETSPDRVRSAIEGYLKFAYRSLVSDQEERFEGHKRLARKIWDNFHAQIGDESKVRVGLPPFEKIDADVVRAILDPETGAPPEIRAVLRTKLNLPAETAPAPSGPAPETPAPK